MLRYRQIIKIIITVMSLAISIHTLEAAAMCTGFLNTYLAARANIWNWLFGIITVTLFFIIFMHAKLYADMGSQVVFFLLQLYGIYQWRYGGKNKTTLSITYTPRHAWMLACLSFTTLFIGLVYLLQHFTDSTTIYLDASTTALSLVAQWMMGRKWVENWLLWVLMDVIALKMYIAKHLYLTCILFFVLLIQSIKGYFIWKKLALIKNA